MGKLGSLSTLAVALIAPSSKASEQGGGVKLALVEGIVQRSPVVAVLLVHVQAFLREELLDDAKAAIKDFEARALALDALIGPFAIRVHFMWHWLGLHLQLVARSYEQVTGDKITNYCYPLLLLERCKQLCREAGW